MAGTKWEKWQVIVASPGFQIAPLRRGEESVLLYFPPHQIMSILGPPTHLILIEGVNVAVLRQISILAESEAKFC